MQSFRAAREGDARRCFEMESAAYEDGEGATLDKITKRIRVYPEGFLVLEIEGQIIGFINSGCTNEVTLSDAEFKDLVGHEPDAPNVVIMSVVVDPLHQGQGLARALMEEFVRRMSAMNKSEIHLICKKDTIELYEKLGYRYVRPSAFAHGSTTWHEMLMRL